MYKCIVVFLLRLSIYIFSVQSLDSLSKYQILSVSMVHFCNKCQGNVSRHGRYD